MDPVAIKGKPTSSWVYNLHYPSCSTSTQQQKEPKCNVDKPPISHPSLLLSKITTLRSIRHYSGNDQTAETVGGA